MEKQRSDKKDQDEKFKINEKLDSDGSAKINRSCECENYTNSSQSRETDEMYDDPIKSSHEYNLCPCSDRKKTKIKDKK